VSTQEPPPVPGDPDLPPERAAALQRAEDMVSRREHPDFDSARLKRPQTVLIGCVMAWIGCARLGYEAFTLLRVNENSSGIDQDQTAKQIDIDVQAAHGLGIVIIFWLLLILTFSILAFLGRQWAGTALVAMAAFFGALALVSLVTAFAPSTFTAAFWSAAAVTMIRLREPSKDWYRALREWKAIKAGA